MKLDELANRISGTLAEKRFDGTLKFDCGDDGVIVLADNVARTQDQDTDCTIKISQDNLGKLLSGKLNPMAGVVTGKLTVSGDIGVAFGLSKLLS